MEKRKDKSNESKILKGRKKSFHELLIRAFAKEALIDFNLPKDETPPEQLKEFRKNS